VYGLQTQVPIPETAVTDPISSHGIQKLAIEKYLLLHRFHRGLDVRIARLSNPFGPGQRLFGRQGFVAMTIGHLLRGEPILLRDEGRPVSDTATDNLDTWQPQTSRHSDQRARRGARCRRNRIPLGGIGA
jgi:UDP-glucose 4-epimerase